MDPRLRADEALARARARGAFVVTPDNATSPMDLSTTQRIPRDVLGTDDGDLQHQPTSPYGWPAASQDIPPNPYYAQRGPEEFGPLGSQAAQQQSQY